MRSLTETARGITASATWIAGIPFANAKVAYVASTKTEGRAIMVRHCQRFLDTCRINVEVQGDLPLPGHGCVLCHNESSFPDLMAYMVTMLDHTDCAAAADIYRFFPFARGCFARIDFDMVQRGNRRATEALMLKNVERLSRGDRVIWGGEGRLSGIDGIRRFKIGAGLVAIRAQVPVIPVAVHGGHHTMPLKSLRARCGTIRIRLGAPVATNGLREEDARDFADQLHQRVAQMYDELAAEAATASAAPEPSRLPS